ncbi:SUMF1/EgtB/PvdO family nonheme iron enzyme [Tatumella sp. UCD-D_suzukii]|uniref:formylglycine-generating enzyme family protein n=1 Tax=Tatumella sp. UCD-D_suzukii TaxID=1408192 RepID=UPI0004702EEE|nr:SUMF1/EgtB/PvdO family nonheme iron enzyme [Tatumella sp. UCD-D_suzukii]
MKKISIIISIISFLLIGCDRKISSENERLGKILVEESISNMVPVQGGEFLMGDFGPLVGEKLPFSINQDDKKLHKVILSDFSISKFKVTNANYLVYLNATGKEKPPVHIFVKDYPSLGSSDYSVGVTWQQAKDYCQWLGHMSGKNIDLPTEAQWEYAARSRGQYLPFATDNGQFEKGKNIPSNDELDSFTDGFGFPFYPIGKFPPNPLGLYDMGLSGSEWTNDWYSANYYEHSAEKDPQGPETGTKKVLRGAVGSNPQYSLTIFRQSKLPIPKINTNDDYQKYGVGPQYVFRCVVNH